LTWLLAHALVPTVHTANKRLTIDSEYRENARRYPPRISSWSRKTPNTRGSMASRNMAP
jgi:hypothetical protein